MNKKLQDLIASVTAKRPRTVLDHILKHGRVTADELKTLYGYNHPPRAARDVRDRGIPLKTTTIAGPDGRPMAAYTIDEDTAVDNARHGGRRAFPKARREALAERYGERCALCGGSFPARALQVDHRVPYEIAGDSDEQNTNDFMLVDGSCNRAKSWSCEHCPNWTVKDPGVCAGCLWASPDKYTHIATEERRRLDLTWDSDEVKDFDRVAGMAQGTDVRTLVKRIIQQYVRFQKG